jgi:methylmalonyl-CoA mutase cobalamin-binding subunit
MTLDDTRRDPFSVLTIRALSRATGVPVETLRTWERRYGFPTPVARIESGHRRYPLESVERLRLAVRALELGHKPSVVLRASMDTLCDLLALGATSAAISPVPPEAPAGSRPFAERCLWHVLRLDGEALVRELHQAFNGVGALDFLADCVGPLLHTLGDAWARGQIEVAHEHFASEHIREFLSSKWRPLSERARGPCVVCATVAGDTHVLGLHMAATALAQAGAQVTFLGAATPPEDVVRTASKQRAGGVALSAAMGANRRALERDVRVLVAGLPGVPIAVGGRGFEPPPEGVLPKPDLRDLAEWVQSLERSP